MILRVWEYPNKLLIFISAYAVNVLANNSLSSLIKTLILKIKDNKNFKQIVLTEKK